MTTTVARGANRPAALARTRKAAQRTPLPPRKMGTLAEEAAKAPTPGEAKAAALVAFLREYGWTAKTSRTGRAVKVVGKHLGMTLVAQWTDGCWDYGASSWTRPDGGVLKVLNVSAARAMVALPRGVTG